MKYSILILLFGSISKAVFSQGTDCSNAIPLTLNGSINNFSTSSSTGSNVLCANNGTTPITWFSLTTNAAGESPLLNLTATDGQPVEIALYVGCGGNMNNNYEEASSMCFYDGTGLWSPAETFNVAPNHTYYLRIKTATLTTITISGQHYNPPNNQCSGALNISPVGITDNNAAHRLGPGVSATQLCASSLENTAFYQYNVATTGTTVINISNISCDNGFNNNLNGFQIGFFTGTCANLQWESCSSGSGSFVQATSGVLPADATVFVAIDGNAGSNCRYEIQAINAYLLATEIKNFSAWETAHSNLLRWTALASTGKYFEIERSENGKDFSSIGRLEVNQGIGTITNYNFEDKKLLPQAFYRLKLIEEGGKTYYTKTCLVTRKLISTSKLMAYVRSNSLQLDLHSDAETRYEYTIINFLGQPLLNGTIFSKKGPNHYAKNISAIPLGRYLIILSSKGERISHGFIKGQGIL